MEERKRMEKEGDGRKGKEAEGKGKNMYRQGEIEIQN